MPRPWVLRFTDLSGLFSTDSAALVAITFDVAKRGPPLPCFLSTFYPPPPKLPDQIVDGCVARCQVGFPVIDVEPFNKRTPGLEEGRCGNVSLYSKRLCCVSHHFASAISSSSLPRFGLHKW